MDYRTAGFYVFHRILCGPTMEMTKLTDEKLAELIKIAHAASESRNFVNGICVDADNIAAFDPDTALALVREVQALREAVEQGDEALEQAVESLSCLSDDIAMYREEGCIPTEDEDIHAHNCSASANKALESYRAARAKEES
jgi:hypothetical protein